LQVLTNRTTKFLKMNKIIKKIIISCLFLGIVYNAKSQQDEAVFNSLSVVNNELIIKLTSGTYKIKPYSEKLIQTSFISTAKSSDYFSFAVNKQAEQVEYKLSETKNEAYFTSKGIVVKIVKSPFSISYLYKNKPLIKENGNCQVTDTLSQFNFAIENTEKLFGAGSRVLGMDRRGHKLPLYNRAHYGFETYSEQMNYGLPVVISSKQYAILFDNPAKGFLDLDSEKKNTLSFGAIGGAMTYYVIAGDNWYNLVEEYTALTGRQPLPPRWAFGNFSSRFGYHSQKEVLNTVNKYISDNIPLDAIVIDIYWFGKEIMGDMGALDWYRDSFPEPDKMLAQLKKQNVKTILVTEPFILTSSSRWKDAVENKALGKKKNGEPYTYDFYFGNTGIVDVFEENSRNWFWNIYKNLTAQGIDGWWGDLGEPEVHPSDLLHSIGTADEVHNAYGHRWLQMIYEGYQKDFPSQRPFILMRAGFAGSQRFGIIPWTGDVSRSWGGLFSQPEISMQMGMQGIAYMHSDLGGFAGGEQIDNELYIRWLQYGVFQPIYRPHAQESIAPEPVFQNDTTKAHAKKAIELRYKLLPYIYNMAFENSQTGKPLMLPLFFNETDNPKLLDYQDAYFWGDAFLISPIKAPNVKKQKIYLPKNTHWFDFYTEKQYLGGQEIEVDVKIQNIPTFVKGGSFIAMKSKAENTASYNLDNFEMHYYLDANVSKSEYKLFNDDGNTPDSFKKGKYELIHFNASKKGKSLSIDIQQVHQFEASKSKEIVWTLHNVENEPQTMSYNGQTIKSTFDKNTKTLHFSILFEEKGTIKLKF